MTEDLQFGDHAGEQLAERQIPEVAVYHVIGDADRVVERDDNCTEYFGEWQGRHMLVVVSYDHQPPRVVTIIVRKRGAWWS